MPDIKIEEAGANDGSQENKLAFTWDLGNGEKFAEKLYNFVKNKLEYDYEKFAQKSNKTLKASEILNLDKGICQDYSILYAA
ncbi:MAG: transglutaminase-like domain-containing protein, partial [Candidatus Humimicrobiaceae bacterium]